MESNKNMYHPNNFGASTYWQYSDNGILEEPEKRTAQYEIDVKDTEFGKKLCIRIFSRVGTDPLHKRDYYTYLETLVDCTFTRSLLDILEGNLEIKKS